MVHLSSSVGAVSTVHECRATIEQCKTAGSSLRAGLLQSHKVTARSKSYGVWQDKFSRGQARLLSFQ